MDMFLFIERGMQGGISMASKRYAKANNPRAVDYDPSRTEQIYHIGREQLLWLGHEPAAAKGRIQVEASDAHQRAHHGAQRKLEDRLDLGGIQRSSTNPTRATRSRQRKKQSGKNRCTKKE